MLERQELSEWTSRCFPHCCRRAEVPVLAQEGQGEPSLARHGAAAGREGARQQLEQGGLARSIPSDDSPPLSGGDRERDIREQGRRPELDCHTPHGYLCHEAARRAGAGLTSPTTLSTSARMRRSKERFRIE